MNNKEIGGRGEGIAADYLKANGYKILKKNFSCKMGEVDIIARKGRDIYFVEVKTRSSTMFGGPFESVTWRKQRRIIRTAQIFLLKHKEALNCHFSMIGIRFDKTGSPSVRFLPDAFQTS